MKVVKFKIQQLSASMSFETCFLIPPRASLSIVFELASDFQQHHAQDDP